MKNKVFKAFCKVPMNLQLFAEGDGAGTGDDGGNGGELVEQERKAMSRSLLTIF